MHIQLILKHQLKNFIIILLKSMLVYTLYLYCLNSIRATAENYKTHLLVVLNICTICFEIKYLQ